MDSLIGMDSKSMVDPTLDPVQYAILCNQSMGVTILPRRGANGAWGYEDVLNEKGREAWARVQGLFRKSEPKHVFTHLTSYFSLHSGSGGTSANLSLSYCIDDAYKRDIVHRTKTSPLVFLEINDHVCYALSYTGSVYHFDRRTFDAMDQGMLNIRLEKAGGGGENQVPITLGFPATKSEWVEDLAPFVSVHRNE
jgi:hypothetical protein